MNPGNSLAELKGKLFSKLDRIDRHKLVLEKMRLSFVSPFVSPGCPKNGQIPDDVR